MKEKEKFYVLNMFPYPSGAGLHVGHPLGYIASDIYARYKRLQGFNVLNPMGYDAYGLPAEQYAIQTGQHPAVTTATNINRYREQLDKIGFCFDWDREVRTCDPAYYHWTQWAFQKMFDSYYCNDRQQARPIEELVKAFPFTINGMGEYKEAVITRGGVSVKEIQPGTMESRKVKNLYFIGEVLDLDAVTGGYNLQIAWSSAYVAGTDCKSES